MQSLKIKALLSVLKNGVDYSYLMPNVSDQLGLIPYDDVVCLLKHTTRDELAADPNIGLKLSATLGLMDALLFFINADANDFNGAMKKAASEGHIDIVELMLKHGADDLDEALDEDLNESLDESSSKALNEALNEAMENAAYEGHKDIVELMMDYGASKNKAMNYAALKGHIDIVELMLKHGARGVNKALKYAASGGQIRIVKLLMEHGADDFDEAVVETSSGGHIDIMKLFYGFDFDVYSLNHAMFYAAEGGFIDMVTLLKEWGAHDLRCVVRQAAANGHIELMKLAIEWSYDDDENGNFSVDDYNDFLDCAGYGGRADVVDVLISHGGNDLNAALVNATCSGHIDLVVFLIEKGSTDVNKALVCAAHYNQVDIAKLLIQKGAYSFDEALKYTNHVEVSKLLKEHKESLVLDTLGIIDEAILITRRDWSF